MPVEHARSDTDALLAQGLQWKWATPVLHVNLLESGEMCPELHSALQAFADRHEHDLRHDPSLLKSSSNAYTRYRSEVFAQATDAHLIEMRDRMNELCDCYVAAVYGPELPPHVRHTQMWFVLQHENDANEAVHAHYHEGSDIAFVYYLNVPTDGSGQVVFIDPRGPVGRGAFALPRHTLTTHVQPAEGDLMIFPRYLMHYTTTNTDSHTRRVIAGSVRYDKAPT
jgi:hypothetical protein